MIPNVRFLWLQGVTEDVTVTGFFVNRMGFRVGGLQTGVAMMAGPPKRLYEIWGLPEHPDAATGAYIQIASPLFFDLTERPSDEMVAAVQNCPVIEPRVGYIALGAIQ